MSPDSISARALAQLTLDQVLRARRGVNFCRKNCVSMAFRWPSIQPWQSAASSASAWVMEARPESFFAICSQTPALPAWCLASHFVKAWVSLQRKVGSGAAGILAGVLAVLAAVLVEAGMTHSA